jgi:hypothetical protein
MKQHELVYVYGSIIGFCLLIFAGWRFGVNGDKHEAGKCRHEENQEFSGIVSGFQTDIFKEQTVIYFETRDSVLMWRSSKEVTIREHDTISKNLGNHRYLIRRYQYSTSDPRKIDTLEFGCQ